MKIKPIKIALYIFALLPLVAVCVFYGKLPEIIPMHWNLSFQADVWEAKKTIFMLPLFSAVGVAALELPIFLKTHEDKTGRIVGEFAFAAIILFVTCFIIYKSIFA